MAEGTGTEGRQSKEESGTSVGLTDSDYLVGIMILTPKEKLYSTQLKNSAKKLRLGCVKPGRRITQPLAEY